MYVFVSFLFALIPTSLLLVLVRSGGWAVGGLKFRWQLISLPLVLFSSIASYAVGMYAKTHQTEAWDFKVSAVHYYEPWDEEVPCRHPIYRTETSTDSKGRTTTRQVFVGYEHPYDVDYHPACWTNTTENGVEHDIGRQTYEDWKFQWGNSHFVDMHRHYHSIDGNMYQSDFTGQFNRIYPWTEFHQYENRVRAADTTNFKFKNVGELIRRRFPQPAQGGDLESLHSYGPQITEADKLLFRRMNADLASRYQIHVLVYLFDASQDDRGVAEDMKGAWEGPNKNELIVPVGLTGGKVTWCEPFSWMDDTTMHSMLRQDMEGKDWNPQALVNDITALTPEQWHRKHFKDFSYLSVSMPWSSSVIAILLALVIPAVSAVIIEKNVSEPWWASGRGR